MKLITLLIDIYPELLKGLWVSLQLSAGALLLGLVLGLPLALIKTYGKGIPKALATGYIEIIRGTPMVVQLFIVYFGLPDVGILLDRVTAAIIALGLNSSAYQAEYFRGALLSIDRGQMMAARALGMTEKQAIMYIMLPQALRLVIPPWSNELIYMVKYTSVAFLIAVPELMARGKMVISRTFLPLETLFWVGVIYIVVLSILAKIVDMVERRYAIPGFEMSRDQ
jgi:polar amino acid transport system permease protein